MMLQPYVACVWETLVLLSVSAIFAALHTPILQPAEHNFVRNNRVLSRPSALGALLVVLVIACRFPSDTTWPRLGRELKLHHAAALVVNCSPIDGAVCLFLNGKVEATTPLVLLGGHLGKEGKHKETNRAQPALSLNGYGL